MKDFSSYGYMQGPIRAMLQEDLTKMGVTVNTSAGTKRRSKAPHSMITPGSQQHLDCGIYGKPLAELETRPVPGQPYIRVPRLLLRSCNFLSHHLETEGLFRKSGSIARQKLIRTSLNEGHGIDESANPHDVANLLKQFLRELPVPLLTYHLYNSFVQSQTLDQEEDKIQSVLLLVLCLPDISRHTLQFLVEFLRGVSDKSYKNKMTVSNLAVVIAPNLLRNANQQQSVECSNIKLETQLVECLIHNSSELGLVPEDIALRAQNMIMELSGIWGVSEQEAAYKIPLKGKRKRSGSLSGMLTSVFRNNKALKHGAVLRSSTTLHRKSFSNQDLTVVKAQPIHGDLSFSTPCIKTPSRPTGLNTRSTLALNTPLMTAQRRTALLRQTPVDPRKKPKGNVPPTSDNTEFPSPIDMDPPKKRSKLDTTPQTEPVKRKNFKQRLSEGLTSRYRKSRLKRKRSRAHRSSESAASVVTVASANLAEYTIQGGDERKRKEKTPVFCFKAKPGSFNYQQKRDILSKSDSVTTTNDIVINNYLESPVQPELDLVDMTPTTLVQGNVGTPGVSVPPNKKKLFPSPTLDSSDDGREVVRTPRPFTSPRDLHISPSDVKLKRNKSYLASCQSVVESRDDKRSARIRRSAPVKNNVVAAQTPVLRRSARLSGNSVEHAKLRTVSGGSYTAAHRVSVNTPSDATPDRLSPRAVSPALNASSITPRTFSRTRCSPGTNMLQAFSPIRVSLNCIAPPRATPSPAACAASLEGSTNRALFEGTCSLPIVTSPLHTEVTAASPRDASAHDASLSPPDCSVNLTDLFTSREMTRLDMSLNVKEFDRNFCQMLANSSPDLAQACPENLDQSRSSDVTSSELDVTSSERDLTQDVTSPDYGDSMTESVANDHSHITYITQNASMFLQNITVHNETDISSHVTTHPHVTSHSHVDFPRFARLPSLPSTIILSPGKPEIKTPTLASSEASQSFTRDFHSNATQSFTRDSHSNATQSFSELNLSDSAPIETSASESVSYSALSVAETSHNITPDFVRDVTASRDVTPVLLRDIPSDLVTSFSSGSAGMLSARSSSNASFSSAQSTFVVPISAPVVTVSEHVMPIYGHVSAPSAPGTPLTFPERHQTDSKQAIVVKPGAATSTRPDSSSIPPHVTQHHVTQHHVTQHHVTQPHVTQHHVTQHHVTQPHVTQHHVTQPHVTQHHVTQHHVTQPHVTQHHVTQPHVTQHHYLTPHYTAVQDDQVSSTVTEGTRTPPEKENSDPKTPKSGSKVELDSTKINITPRTKISRGFTKNLASQWENMNRNEDKPARGNGRKTRIPQRSASRYKRSPVKRAGSQKARTRVSSRDSSKTPKRGTLTRAASVRLPASSAPTRPVIRTKSDNSGANSGAARPAWRF